MPERKRYDYREDRANDKKTHDNPNHPGKHSHDKALAEAKSKEREKEE